MKANGRTIASKAIKKTGLEVADDVAQGKSFKESAKRRIPKGIKEAAEKINWQTGSGTSKRKRRRLLLPHRKRVIPRCTRRGRYNDIFG